MFVFVFVTGLLDLLGAVLRNDTVDKLNIMQVSDCTSQMGMDISETACVWI